MIYPIETGLRDYKTLLFVDESTRPDWAAKLRYLFEKEKGKTQIHEAGLCTSSVTYSPGSSAFPFDMVVVNISPGSHLLRSKPIAKEEYSSKDCRSCVLWWIFFLTKSITQQPDILSTSWRYSLYTMTPFKTFSSRNVPSRDENARSIEHQSRLSVFNVETWYQFF